MPANNARAPPHSQKGRGKKRRSPGPSNGVPTYAHEAHAVHPLLCMHKPPHNTPRWVLALRWSWPVRTVAELGISWHHITGADYSHTLISGIPPHHLRAGARVVTHSPARAPLVSRNLIHP